MDIKGIKKELAGLMGTMLRVDPITGVPYTAPPAMIGARVKALSEAPMSLAETDLPTWLFYVGSAAYPAPPDQTVGRLSKETRDIVCCLYVCIAQAGIDGEAERKALPYMDVSRNLFQSHPLIYDGNISDRVPGIMRAYLVKDDGIVQLKFGTGEPITYDGLRYTLRFDGYNEVTYGNE